MTNGCRVLTVVAKGNTLVDAHPKVYGEIEKIQCNGLFNRKGTENKGI